MKWIRYSALLLTVLVAACGGKGSPADPPADLTLQSNGDTQVTLNWTAQPGLQYWVMCAPGTTVDAKSWASTVGGNAYRSASDGAGIYNGDLALASQAVIPPFNVTGLRNDVTYSFTVNARVNGGPGGVGATPVTIKPRLAGTNWSALGTVPGATAIRAMSYGVPVGTTHFVSVAVGDSGAIYSSTDNQKTWNLRSLPSGVTARSLNDVTFMFGRFIAVGDGGTILNSSDGAVWSASTISGSLPVSNANLTSLANNGSTLMAVGQGGTVLTSADGVSWAPLAANIPQNVNLHAVAYSPAVATTTPTAISTSAFWIAVGSAGAVYTSVDGVAWTPSNTNLSGMTGAWRGVSVLVNTTSTLDCGLASSAVTSVSTSYSVALVGEDGMVATAGPSMVWTTSKLDVSGPILNRVISPAGQFVAVGNAGVVYTGNLSADASSVSWSRRSSGTGSDLYGLVRYGKDAGLSYSNSYIAYGQGGLTLFSR